MNVVQLLCLCTLNEDREMHGEATHLWANRT